MKLFTLGCSLAPQYSWPESFNKHLQPDEWFHTGMGAGSNGAQILQFELNFIKHSVGHQDTIVWQITGEGRYSGVANKYLIDKYSDTWNNKFKKFGDQDKFFNGNWIDFENYLDNANRRLWFGNHEFAQLNGRYRGLNDTDANQELQRLLFNLVSAKRSGAQVVVFRGWTGCINKLAWQRFKQVFDKEGIGYTDKCIVEWCLTNELPFMDDLHPTHHSGMKFAEQVLFDKIKKI